MNRLKARPFRPALYAEQSLVTAILNGEIEPGGTLPGERELAGQLGVTRPTLREALQRLDRDGWISVQHGKSTRVNDCWKEGGLNVLSAIVRHAKRLPPGFVVNLLEVRLALAPAYTRAAVENAGRDLADFMRRGVSLGDTAREFAAFDWQVHYRLTVCSGNPVYTLILNGFGDFYEHLAEIYFASAGARDTSRKFYAALERAALSNDAAAAERVTRRVMAESVRLWKLAERRGVRES